MGWRRGKEMEKNEGRGMKEKKRQKERNGREGRIEGDSDIQ